MMIMLSLSLPKTNSQFEEGKITFIRANLKPSHLSGMADKGHSLSNASVIELRNVQVFFYFLLFYLGQEMKPVRYEETMKMAF